MAKAIYAAILAYLFLGGPALAAEPIRVMTFNIRFGTAPDGENAWPHRRDLLIKVIREADPDLLGLQEALRSQLDQLVDELPQYVPVGVGREADGQGEYSAILFRRGRFDLAAAETFWLSDSPTVPGSRTWGNALSRICTWARFLDRTNGQRIWVFNTHWDHQSQPARLESGRLIARRIKELASEEPVVVMGDFNAGEDNAAIAALTENGRLLEDTFRKLHPDKTQAGTFHGFSGNPGKEKIDAVFIRGPWQTSEAQIVDAHEGDRYPSDHFPVTATISLAP